MYRDLELETDRSECISLAKFLDKKTLLNGEKVCIDGVIFRFDFMGNSYSVYIVGKHANYFASSFPERANREKVMLKRLEKVAYEYN